MDHDTTREQLELAAVEPGGLDRLVAGDTATAQAVAGHLAGCLSCTAELGRLQRASTLIREVAREIPPADLRERTLATVRAAGVARGAGADVGIGDDESAVAVATGASPAAAAPAAAAPPPVGRTSPAIQARSRAALGWVAAVAAVAAAVVLSVAATSVIVGGRVDERLASQARTIGALEKVTSAALLITSEPDVRRVALSGAEPGLAGSLLFSPSTSELVVVATGLTPPPAGQEYRCWVEQAGERQGVGKMFFSEGLAYWVGPVPAIKGLVGEATFGVSLVDLDGVALDPEPVLDGGL